MNEMERKLATALRESGSSITTPRRLVFRAMLDQEPISMTHLVRILHGTVDRATIYRTIEALERAGVVNRLQIGWKYKLELSEEFSSHHHHLTCLNCGRIYDVEENSTIEFELRQLALERGFKMTSHQLEIRGLCAHCK